MKDERTTQVLQKIHSEMVMIMILLCALSMLIKVLLYGRGLEDAWLEWFIMVGSPIYQLIRTRMLKVSMVTGPSNMSSILKRSSTGIIVVLFMFGLMAIMRPEAFSMKFVVTFIIPFILLSLAVRIITTKSEERHARKLGDEYDDEG